MIGVGGIEIAKKTEEPSPVRVGEFLGRYSNGGNFALEFKAEIRPPHRVYIRTENLPPNTTDYREKYAVKLEEGKPYWWIGGHMVAHREYIGFFPDGSSEGVIEISPALFDVDDPDSPNERRSLAMIFELKGETIYRVGGRYWPDKPSSSKPH